MTETKDNLRVLVCGGRHYGNVNAIYNALDEIKPTVVISGCASGADSIAIMWAEHHGVAVEKYPAQWHDISHPDALVTMRRDGSKYDARAGTRRNQRMIEEGNPDVVLAFPGGTGTADMTQRAQRAGIKVRLMRE